MSEQKNSMDALHASESSPQSEHTPPQGNSSPESGDHAAYNPTEIWWPHPSALDDLTVEETEEGFTLSAPDDTECAAWLSYFNQSEERREVFERAFEGVIHDFLEKLKHVEAETVTDQPSGGGVETETDVSGAQP